MLTNNRFNSAFNVVDFRVYAAMMLHQCHESPVVILAKARVVVAAAAVMVVELSQDQSRKNQKEDLAE